MRGLLARLLRELGLLDLVFELGELVLAVLVAELLLDRLHLLVEVVLALRLLHLPLDARADALLDLQHRDFALHQAEHLLQPLGDRRRLQDLLLVGNLDREMRRDRVGELGVVLDLLDDADDFGRHLLVELHIVLELVDDRARQRFGLDLLARASSARTIGLGLVDIRRGRCSASTLARCGALDQHLDGAVGQLEQLQHARERADLVDRVRSPDRRRTAFFWVASRMNVSERITSSSALIDFSRPTKSGTIMCGNTTMSRSGSTG